MDNHVHFIVEPITESALAKLFSVVNIRYSQHFNKKKGVRGQLWQGRFFSCPLDKEHLYEAIRYVELNPLRAGITSSIEAYSWSSLQDHLLGKGRYPVDDLSEYLEIDDWKTYLSESINEDVLDTLRERTKTNRPAGNASFIKKLEHLSGKTFNLAGRGRPRKKVEEVK